MTDVEDTGYLPGSRTVRRSATGIAYAKRILIANGPFDLSAWGGLGYQHIATRYIKVKNTLFVPDPVCLRLELGVPLGWHKR